MELNFSCVTIYFFENVIKLVQLLMQLLFLFHFFSFVIDCTLLELEVLTSLFEFKKGRVKGECYYILSIKNGKWTNIWGQTKKE